MELEKQNITITHKNKKDEVCDDYAEYVKLKTLGLNVKMSNTYKIIDMIGSGSFGDVFSIQTKNGKNRAMKTEKKSNSSKLKEEYKIYKKLKKNGVENGIPKIYTFLESESFNYMTMELLYKSLDEMFNLYNKKFNVSTVIKLGLSIVNLLESIHNAGYIHRDIKPNNFMIDNSMKNIYIMDFGLSKQYIVNNQHIELRTERSLVGTARYASINVHMGFEPSRRDDLEAVGYMLIYFLRGELPWQGLKKKNKQNQIKLIGNTKIMTNITQLCNDLPKCFLDFILYCKSLKFEDCPDYKYLTSLFNNYASDNNINLQYMWLK